MLLPRSEHDTNHQRQPDDRGAHPTQLRTGRERLMTIVLDASALLAFLQDEPGSDLVEAALHR